MLLNVEAYCAIRYGLPKGEEPTKAQKNTVTQMCRDGTLECVKSGKRWLIRIKEFEDG